MAIAAHDFVSTSPTNTFATLNPLQKDADLTLSDGSLFVTFGGIGGVGSTFYISSGIYYWEIYYKTTATTIDVQYGVISNHRGTTTYLGNSGYKSYGVILNNGNSIHNATQVADKIADGSAGDVYRILLDMDQGEWKVAINSGSFTTIHTGITDAVSPAVASNNTAVSEHVFNFGQDSSFGGTKTGSANATDANGLGDFYHSVPTGAQALCTSNIQSNLAIDPAVDVLPEDYFVPIAYSGQNTNLTIDSISYNLRFTPDLIFLKWRSGVNSTNSWMIFDSIRGFSNYLQSDNTNAQSNSVSAINSVSSSGVELKHLDVTNQSGANYVGYFWKAGGNSNTFNIDGTGYSSYDNLQSANSSLPASTTSGMITPTGMSVGVKQGVSIVRFNGNGTANATVPHGLNKPIEMLLCKQISDSSSFVGYAWNSWHIGLSNNSFIALNTTDEESSASSIWVTSGMTNQVFTHGTAHTVMNSGTGDYIAYCFTSIEGYSAFGSYTAVSGSDNAFVALGFSPSFIMIKCISGGDTGYGSWFMADNVRSQFNPSGGSNVLWANSSVAEGKRGNVDATTVGVIGTNDYLDVDFLSNGFKIRAGSNAGEIGKEDAEYLYACFAEMPQKYAVAR